MSALCAWPSLLPVRRRAGVNMCHKIPASFSRKGSVRSAQDMTRMGVFFSFEGHS